MEKDATQNATCQHELPGGPGLFLAIFFFSVWKSNRISSIDQWEKKGKGREEKGKQKRGEKVAKGKEFFVFRYGSSGILGLKQLV